MKSTQASAIARLLRTYDEPAGRSAWPVREATEGYPGLPASPHRPLFAPRFGPGAEIADYDDLAATVGRDSAGAEIAALDKPVAAIARDDPAAAKKRSRIAGVLGIVVLFLLGTWAGATLVPRLIHHGAIPPEKGEPPTIRPEISLEGLGRSALHARNDAATGRALGRVSIPRLGIVAEIREGIDAIALMLAVGHVPGTAFPGEDGNVALAGLGRTFFRGLETIRAHDLITLSTSDGLFAYRVERAQVMPADEIAPWSRSEDHTLTLVSTLPFSPNGVAGRQRLVVTALETGSAPPTVVPAPDRSSPPWIMECGGGPPARVFPAC